MKYSLPTIEQWESFFEAVNHIGALTPWRYLAADDCVLIQLDEPRDPVLCSVMGSTGVCPGIAVFPGERGFRDFYRFLTIGEGIESPDYILHDLSFLALYWGGRDEVPADQKAAMKALGLRYRGSEGWPYALSFRSRFHPSSPDAQELELFTEALKNLYMVVRGLAEGRFSPEGYDSGNMLYRWHEKGTELWHIAWVPRIAPPAEHLHITLQDELLRARLRTAPQTKARIIMDLVYLEEGYQMRKGIRYDAELACCMLDEGKHTIVYLDIVPPHMDEINGVFNGFVSYIKERGRMRQIRARNPWVLFALEEICAECGIKLIPDELPEVDELLEELPGYLV